MDDYDGQMMFGDLVGLMLPDIRLTGEKKLRKNLTQETCSDQGSNPDPLRGKRACYHLLHSGGQHYFKFHFIAASDFHTVSHFNFKLCNMRKNMLIGQQKDILRHYQR